MGDGVGPILRGDTQTHGLDLRPTIVDQQCMQRGPRGVDLLFWVANCDLADNEQCRIQPTIEQL